MFLAPYACPSFSPFSLGSYSVYLELLYQDLLASAGLTLPPCNGGALTPSTPASTTSASSGESSGGISGEYTNVVEASVVGAVNRRTAAASDTDGLDRGLSDPSSTADTAPGTAYCQAYNLLLTPHWMLVVPRTERVFEGHVDINGMGFAGMLLARDAVGMDAVQRHGPLEVLKAVAYPL